MFGFGFGGKSGKKEAPVEVQPLSANISEAILKVVGLKAIAPMPFTAQRAFQLSTNPEADIKDFLELLEEDEALAARVMKIANSVYFDRGKPTATLEESITVIGLNELKGILGSTSLSDIFSSSLPERQILWGHDIAVAISARVIAEVVIPYAKDVAFMSGLLHDIGKLFLLQRLGERYRKVVKLADVEGREFRVLEAELFPFDHTEVGQLIATRWNFAKEITAAIRHHHMEWQKLEARSIAAVVKMADLLSYAYGIGHDGRFSRLKEKAVEELPIGWNKLAINAVQAESLIKRCKEAYEAEYHLFEKM